MTPPPLPEPFDYCYEWETGYGIVRKFSATPHHGIPPTRTVALYTADQMRAALAAVPAQPVRQPGAEPIGWQYRWTNPGSDPMVHQQDIDWKPVASRAPAQTIQQRIDELRSHKYTDGKPCYEVRAIYTQAAPAQRQPLSDMQIFAATHAEMDSLLDHICDEGTASIGVKRRLCHFAHVIQRECAAAWGVTLAASPNTGEAK